MSIPDKINEFFKSSLMFHSGHFYPQQQQKSVAQNQDSTKSIMSQTENLDRKSA